ncbi:delta-60 repeat domain-containing protein [Candidatus Nephthysia bennettiae]|uniref:delta-60 repeat domain-containing protein n=1 Tax=Candidatus Nephthysia bennettiae TaxID=3127016 RepID=UPI0033130388
MLVQPDGEILVGGSATQGQNKRAPVLTAIARYNPNGSLDPGLRQQGTGPCHGIGNVTAIGLDAQRDIFLLDRSSGRRSAPAVSDTAVR